MKTSSALSSVLLLSSGLVHGQSLVDPSAGILEVVTPPSEAPRLDMIDGLAFDAFDNLFGVREVTGAGGGVVYVDKATGLVTELVAGISRADQIALHPSGDLYLTSEVSPTSTTNRVYRLSVSYAAGNVPQASGTVATGLTTSLAILKPEGIVVLPAGPYGNAGDLVVAEDDSTGRLLIVDPTTGTTTALTGALARPEGMAFGDFAGAATAALYVAETTNHNVLKVEPNGATSVFGNGAAVSLTSPDNLEFGPDGFLYVSEDRPFPTSRVLRVAPDGTFSVFATGFGQAQGMIFDPVTDDMYIAEQDFDRIWRVRFVTPPGEFCNGTDGSLTSCPCANPGDPGSGCDNSGLTGGVRCDVTAFDPAGPNAALFCSGYPVMGNPTALLIRSPNLIAGGPLVFGDGLRCVASPVVRMAATTAFNGGSGHSFGHGVGPGTYHYQAWYRNTPGSFCVPGAFNLSSGVTLFW